MQADLASIITEQRFLVNELKSSANGAKLNLNSNGSGAGDSRHGVPTKLLPENQEHEDDEHEDENMQQDHEGDDEPNDDAEEQKHDDDAEENDMHNYQPNRSHSAAEEALTPPRRRLQVPQLVPERHRESMPRNLAVIQLLDDSGRDVYRRLSQEEKTLIYEAIVETRNVTESKRPAYAQKFLHNYSQLRGIKQVKFARDGTDVRVQLNPTQQVVISANISECIDFMIREQPSGDTSEADFLKALKMSVDRNRLIGLIRNSKAKSLIDTPPKTRGGKAVRSTFSVSQVEDRRSSIASSGRAGNSRSTSNLPTASSGSNVSFRDNAGAVASKKKLLKKKLHTITSSYFTHLIYYNGAVVLSKYN